MQKIVLGLIVAGLAVGGIFALVKFGPKIRPPAPSGISSEIQKKRDEIGAYLIKTDLLYTDYQNYFNRTQATIKKKSLVELAERKKEIDAIIAKWKLILPPAELKHAHELMLEAWIDDRKGLGLTEEGLKNHDVSKIIQAAEMSDMVAEKILAAKKETKKVLDQFK